jgi:hypothetical protein
MTLSLCEERCNGSSSHAVLWPNLLMTLGIKAFISKLEFFKNYVLFKVNLQLWGRRNDYTWKSELFMRPPRLNIRAGSCDIIIKYRNYIKNNRMGPEPNCSFSSQRLIKRKMKTKRNNWEMRSTWAGPEFVLQLYQFHTT